jgi:hypothetical protein
VKEIADSMVLSRLPIVASAVTITIEMMVAISAYSIEVAPAVSLARSFTRDRAAWE